MAAAIEIQGLTKEYVDVWGKQRVQAVKSLNLTVEEGEIFGFLGRNGAGKTTTIKMLLGLLFPTAGDATLLGKPMGDSSVKNLISYLPEETYFYDSMSAWDLLDFYGRLFKIPDPERQRRIKLSLEKVRLQPEAWKRNIRSYSKGMRQRTGIAQALINDPKLLFLDEPTSGLDPIAHAELRNIVGSLRGEGKTVFLSSHQLADVQDVCDRVAILHQGELKELGRVDSLLKVQDVTQIHAKGLDEKTKQEIKELIARSSGEMLRMDNPTTTMEELFLDIVRESDQRPGRRGSGA